MTINQMLKNKDRPDTTIDRMLDKPNLYETLGVVPETAKVEYKNSRAKRVKDKK